MLKLPRSLSLLLPVLLVLAVGLPACATTSSIGMNLDKVSATVQDGTLVLDSIQTFADAILVAKPNPELAAKIGVAESRARAALAAASRIISGAKELGQSNVDSAFLDFRDAYGSLLALVAPLGVSTATISPDGGTARASLTAGPTLSVPAASALVPRV